MELVVDNARLPSGNLLKRIIDVDSYCQTLPGDSTNALFSSGIVKYHSSYEKDQCRWGASQRSPSHSITPPIRRKSDAQQEILKYRQTDAYNKTNPPPPPVSPLEPNLSKRPSCNSYKKSRRSLNRTEVLTDILDRVDQNLDRSPLENADNCVKDTPLLSNEARISAPIKKAIAPRSA